MVSQNLSKNNVIKIISGSKGKYPIKLGIIPNKLAVTIHLHYVTIAGKSVHCWSYVSDGLISLKQKELVFTLCGEEDQDTSRFPTQPLQFFLLVYKYASQSKQFHAGDITKLGEKGLFGFAAMGYVFPLVSIPNAPFTRPTLSCILLTKEELLAAQAYGLTRVVAQMGYAQNRYPCLPCNDRQRKSLALQSLLHKSALKNIPRGMVKHASVFMADGDQVVLNLPPAVRPQLVAVLKKQHGNGAVSLLLQLSEKHEGCLVWLPDKDATEMNIKPNAAGDSIAGCFLILAPGQPHNSASIAEDGFSMQFTAEAWQQFTNAILGTQNLQIPGEAGGMNFSLVWGDYSAGNPALQDGGNALAEGNFVSRLLSRWKK
jgi:hypothetical protein